MEYKIIKNKIIHFKNAIANVDEVFNFLDKKSNDLITDWLPWIEFGGYGDRRHFRDYGYSKSIYSSQLDYFKDNFDYSDTINILKSIIYDIEMAWDTYQQLFSISNPRNIQNDFAVLKYHDYATNSQSSELGLHVDHPDPNNTNEHTMLIYWNENYEGGEIVFPEIKETIIPKAGDIVTFSSVDRQLIHHTMPVTSGNKVFTLQLWQDGATKGFYSKDHTKNTHGSHLNDTKKNLVVCPNCNFWGKPDEFKMVGTPIAYLGLHGPAIDNPDL